MAVIQDRDQGDERMPGMTPDLHQRFERLLLDHPQWATHSVRRALLRVLRDYEIWDHIEWDGSPATVALGLLQLYTKHGPRPFRAVLASLREGRTDPAYLQAMEALSREVLGLEARPRRRTWKGDPYRGLPYLDRQHAPIFFGRDEELERLIRTLTTTELGARFTVVLGASGSGKSSLVRAGLWARLAEGDVPSMPGSEKWLISVMTPLDGSTPEASLRNSLLQAINEHDGFEDKRVLAEEAVAGSLRDLAERLLPCGDARWLLILDQMEELFAAPEPARKAETAAFLDRLLEATRPRSSGEPSRFQVLATLRADFFHHCLQHEPLKRAVERSGGQFLLSAPGRLGLERMISGPITEVHLPQPWTLDAELPPEMAADAWRHPCGMALMAFALRELYECCQPNRRLDLHTYRGEKLGGLGGVIARRADAALAALGASGPAALQSVFARLVRLSREHAPIRKRERRSAWRTDPEGQRLVDALVNARLLVADASGAAAADPMIEVAHEALLTEWPLLAAWIHDRREAFRIAASVRAQARAWMDGDPAYHNRRPLPADLVEDRRTKLAEAGLLDDLLQDQAVARLLAPEVDWILAELAWTTTTHTRRRDLGQRLAEIGDPRPGSGVIGGLPDILWRPVPAGDVELETHGRFPVAPFYIAAFPITFAQFHAFVAAEDGYVSERWWKLLPRASREATWEDPLTNHPVTNVSWYDATAFCRWLTRRLRLEVRLPDEHEWQWAAQSAQREFAYPWGVDWRPEAANTLGSGINRTTAVGMYPHASSRQGVADLAGNVWEWCRNEYEDPRQTQPGAEPRVLRGGSWDYNPELARADLRFNLRPYSRNAFVGFRVVCSSPIPGTLSR